MSGRRTLASLPRLLALLLVLLMLMLALAVGPAAAGPRQRARLDDHVAPDERRSAAATDLELRELNTESVREAGTGVYEGNVDDNDEDGIGTATDGGLGAGCHSVSSWTWSCSLVNADRARGDRIEAPAVPESTIS